MDARADASPSAHRNGEPAARDKHSPPIWDVLAKLGEGVPAEDLDRLPTDLARNLDHYLYGVPKRG